MFSVLFIPPSFSYKEPVSEYLHPTYSPYRIKLFGDDITVLRLLYLDVDKV